MNGMRANPPPRLPGFGHINRYWDPLHGAYVAKILPGEFFVSISGEAIVTVLGSCVSACIRDPALGIGGMNHFMLPSTDQPLSGSNQPALIDRSARYGNHAMEQLINGILGNGGQRNRLEIKVFGGGKVLKAVSSDIGKNNIDFIHDYLRLENLALAAEDVGDIYPRKVYYFPHDGRARVKKLRDLHNRTILERELIYRSEIEHAPVTGEVELF
ncbi:MAG: chemoreceptor glutamine deamidase CheD [Gammaproteobacteria bacterium]|nr:chemoreceptor glutamine deamidase CheD [Gammaproteobacteria bacterium]MBU1655319.1 chemoreceptor glutamine deamidase CheD [Gammaproteobacteria bacterium]MBU1961464.1 chemoreceptor glutamine deamidase CheD [Gammaproteobacteria bacterium]